MYIGGQLSCVAHAYNGHWWNLERMQWMIELGVKWILFFPGSGSIECEPRSAKNPSAPDGVLGVTQASLIWSSLLCYEKASQKTGYNIEISLSNFESLENFLCFCEVLCAKESESAFSTRDSKIFILFTCSFVVEHNGNQFDSHLCFSERESVAYGHSELWSSEFEKWTLLWMTKEQGEKKIGFCLPLWFVDGITELKIAGLIEWWQLLCCLPSVVPVPWNCETEFTSELWVIEN